jgi:hypothetical protein
VEAADYPTYIRNLRAIGVPEQTVGDIVIAEVLQGFASQRAESLATHHGDFKFWRRASPDGRCQRVWSGFCRYTTASVLN